MSTGGTQQQNERTYSGAEILVEALIRQGVKVVFAYPGGASMPIHQSLRKNEDRVRTVLPRHEQGGGFAAQGYARSTGEVGVCFTTSGPGATNLITSLADAKMDSVPIIGITGQVPLSVIGTDAFQETPTVEICRAITKHHYLITNLKDIPRIVKEAFYIARSGRPGPVLIDFPKDIQLQTQTEEPDYDPPLHLPGYRPESRRVQPEQIKQVIAALRESKRPILYVGGGCNRPDAAAELRRFVERTGVPVALTMRGLGAFPGDHELCLNMLGMHGTVYANYAINHADLLLAFGVRFDDRVTGKLAEFAKHGKIVHVDIDPAEIHKNKESHIPIVADTAEVLKAINLALSDEDIPKIDQWHRQIAEWKKKYPMPVKEHETLIYPQFAITELWKRTKDKDVYVATGVGQHQMWVAQYYKFNEPWRFLSSCGLGTMGFGLPAAVGAKVAHPDSLVIDVDGDGSLLMNIQELATIHCEKVPVKIILLNNQHLGMVAQWEDRFMNGRRAHTYLGPTDRPEAKGEGKGTIEHIYPDFVTIAKGFEIPARQVRTKAEFLEALDEMLSSDGPFLLDVVCPYQEHVLPMIPAGATVKEVILE